MANNKTEKPMKKILLVAFAVFMGTASFAQFQAQPKVRETIQPKTTNDMPNWAHIATPFTATDINGNTVDLQAILNSGTSVVIDYSCTWCGPCWNMHQSGLLEAINNITDVQVIWVEIESNNTIEAIYGNSAGGSTQGNWTIDGNGDPVPYPIIDDNASRTCLSTCASLYEGFVPSIFFIAPSGYFCSIYGESYGFSTSTPAATAIANIQALKTMAPAPNTAPVININGFNSALLDNPVTYTADIISVDSILAIDWTFTGATLSTATGTTATTTFNTPGSQMVTLTVTNTTGTTTDTLNVNVFEWNWGNEMSYCGNHDIVTGIGANGNITWGVSYPASLMAGRNYLDSVQFYSLGAGDYTLNVYQTNPGQTPTISNLIFQNPYTVSTENDWVNLPIYERINLDDTKDLWIALTNTGITYPVAATDFCGDANGSWVSIQDQWYYIFDLNSDLTYTWMIKTTTSADAPAMHIDFDGIQEGYTNETYTFTAAGPAGATFSWDFQSATNPTANGITANATWNAAGTYTITLTATMGDETATKSKQITIFSCDPLALPFSCGFEASDNMGCWKFIDADGDGFGWELDLGFGHNGDNAAASASFINRHPLTPDNWMITPQLIIPAEGATLKFFVGGIDANYFDEKYSVLVSTTGANTTDFTHTITNNTVSTVNYVQKSYDLSSFAGQTIRIAIRHHNSTDVYWMLIDDLEVVAGQHAGIDDITAQVALYPNPTTGILNILADGLQEVSVLDINGRNVMTFNNSVIDMSDLANGVYFVRVITNNGISTQKIIKH